ncbi:MAG: hypothetical protein OEV59_04705 [Deltaproteobacteria bacterium]|nr:hypothetical protein [Deltaproteobacteria bacterium]
MRLKALASILFLCFLVCGCAMNSIDIVNSPPSKILRLNVAAVTIKNTAEIEPWRNQPYSSTPNPLREGVQAQFHSAVLKKLENLFVSSSNGQGKATIKIERAVIMNTTQGIKNVVVVGWFFLGNKEDYIAIIDGSIEIEDKSGQVVERIYWKVKTNVSGSSLTEARIREASSKAANMALDKLEGELEERAKRYLLL